MLSSVRFNQSVEMKDKTTLSVLAANLERFVRHCILRDLWFSHTIDKMPLKFRGNSFLRTASFRSSKYLMYNLTSAPNSTIKNPLDQRDNYSDTGGSELFVPNLELFYP